MDATILQTGKLPVGQLSAAKRRALRSVARSYLWCGGNCVLPSVRSQVIMGWIAAGIALAIESGMTDGTDSSNGVAEQLYR